MQTGGSPDPSAVPRDAAIDPSAGFPIIGIGASAGGIEAFHRFFENLPADCGMAFVVILHLPPDRKSLLAEILARWTGMRVLEGLDGVVLEPNTVYVPPAHTLATLAGRALRVRRPTLEEERSFRPIDAFFDSLGGALRDRAVGIVLSGTGTDGTLGLKALKESGGLTIAQGRDGNAPLFGEMADGAIATGVIDLVAPVEAIPAQLLRLRGGRIAPLPAATESESTDAARLEICAILRAQLGHDFSGYRDQTFLRRVQRRMQVVNVATLADYVARLRADANEVVLLFRDLLIRVTSFFRDKPTFELLESDVIPRLFAGKDADGDVRVWVPGCATGEEAYSLAILLREQMDRLRAAPRVKVFATDIDDSAIATARLGRYPTTLLEGLSDARRDRFFHGSHDTWRVSNEIRALCTFSAHNLVRDPPFSRIDLVSCRNLLIYLSAELQARIIPVFHYALVPDGILLLGSSESAAQHLDLFEPIDKTARIFRRRAGRSPALHLGAQPPDLVSRALSSGLLSMRTADPPDQDDRSEVPHTPAPPTPQSDLSDPLVPKAGESVLPAADYPESMGTPTAEEFAALGERLRHAEARLQAVTENYQTVFEELRSANEELHSVNEELQSTNEELETSKEELQSLNEELHTVNLRLTEKVSELDATNSDLRNLFESTQIATIFLDRHLVIRSFTPAIATLYNLIPSDQGRPLLDIRNHLRYASLREDVDQVLRSLEPLERRITREDGSQHYIMRILPYREPDSTVSGVLVTFVDVTNIVKAEAALVEADVRKDVFLATLSHELRNPLAPIRTAAHLLRTPDLPPEQLARAQSIIARQVSHMSSLLDDLLDVSRITRGAFLLKKQYVDLQALLEAAVEAVQPMVEARRHTLRVEGPGSPLQLEVDPVRLTQVLSNLLTNAVKYTPPGGLLGLTVGFEGHSLVLAVRDSGVGLAPEMTQKIFTMFTRIDSELNRSEGGLGIGLALAKGLVDLHGGRVEARSAGLGQGSEFRVILPRSVIQDPAARRGEEGLHEASPAVARRILIADDNIDAAESLEILLKYRGHEVHRVHSGHEALEVARRVRPEVGVLDIGMPDLDGYEVAERIRHEAWGGSVILIALTGWGQEEDRRRAQLAGFDHHLTKPIDPEELERLFGRAVERKPR